nr:GNAT family N-acetyltransferase [uncultured Actinotalea sp.]
MDEADRTVHATRAWRVLDTPVPRRLDLLADPGHPDSWALHGAARVLQASALDADGHDDRAVGVRALGASLQEQQYSRRHRLVVVDADVTAPQADDVVGTAFVVLPQHSNQHLTEISLAVRPGDRGRGAGTALLEAAESLALAAGRSTLLVETEHRGEPAAGAPGVLEPASGAGRIRADEPGARLCRNRGYVLEQAARYSVLDLPVAPTHLGRLHDDAAARAGSAYRLVSWQDRAPEERLADWALLETRMSTDDPLAGIDYREDPWDAERLRRYEEQVAAAGRGYLAVAAEHVATGVLAGFTLVQWEHDRPPAVLQDSTIVLAEHRGHRLGMLVKAGLLLRLAEARPEARRVHTWNAEENAFMLAINVALGFRPAGVSGEWQKRLG